MTVAVAGLWELGHNVPLQEACLWEMVVRDFMVDEWHMSPVTGIDQPRVTEWADAGAMLEALRRQHHLVFVTEGAPCYLSEFKHPENACYVFGKCNWSPFTSFAEPGDLSLCIETPAGDGLLWPHQCAATALWHRGRQWQ